MSAELKPCPFCSGVDIRIDHHRTSDPRSPEGYVYSMCCYKCGATFPNRFKRELMVESWNRRPGSAQDSRRTVGCGDGNTYIVNEVPRVNPRYQVNDAVKMVAQDKDAARYRWALPILTGSDEGDVRALRLAASLIQGLDGDIAIDAAMAVEGAAS